MLENVLHFNDLSPKLREKLEKRIESYGSEVKYNFAISSQNPDPEKYNGKVIWPSVYNLDPIVFDIMDKEEDRKGKSKSKKVAIIDGVDEKGTPNMFGRIRVEGRYEGVLTLDLEKREDIERAAIIEMHPKFLGGLFQDEKRVPIISRLDEQKDSKEKRKDRIDRSKALNAAVKMTNEDARKFAAAMNWKEDGDIEVLRNKVEEQAEKYPKIFNDLLSGPKLEYQAAVKMAITRHIIGYDPVGGKFLWTENQQVIAVLGPNNGSQTEIEQFGDFLSSNGQKGEEIFMKIKALLKS